MLSQRDRQNNKTTRTLTTLFTRYPLFEGSGIMDYQASNMVSTEHNRNDHTATTAAAAADAAPPHSIAMAAASASVTGTSAEVQAMIGHDSGEEVSLCLSNSPEQKPPKARGVRSVLDCAPRTQRLEPHEHQAPRLGGRPSCGSEAAGTYGALTLASASARGAAQVAPKGRASARRA